jgi:hypothetical protein
MGQYYRPSILKVNHKLAKNPVEATLRSWDFQNGAKLMEHSWIGNSLVNAFIHLIGEDSPYYGQVCVWAGDYADGYTNRMTKQDADADNIYNFASLVDEKLGKCECYSSNHLAQANAKYHKLFGKDIFSTGYYEGTDGHRREYMTCKGNVTEYKYILNLTTKEYIEIPEDNPDEWQEHPLPILLADGNGRGGGDYEGSNMQMVGKWKFNRIGATNNVPKGFKKLEVTFKER